MGTAASFRSLRGLVGSRPAPDSGAAALPGSGRRSPHLGLRLHASSAGLLLFSLGRSLVIALRVLPSPGGPMSLNICPNPQNVPHGVSPDANRGLRRRCCVLVGPGLDDGTTLVGGCCRACAWRRGSRGSTGCEYFLLIFALNLKLPKKKG